MCILTCVIWKNGIDHLIWKVEVDTGLERRMYGPQGEREGWEELGVARIQY